MGYQLWISPQTGYRRRGTSVAELRSLLEQGVTARSVAEPLRCCLTTDPAADVCAEMTRLDFDVIGVLKPNDTVVAGWLHKTALRDTERVISSPFNPADLISESTALVHIIHHLADTERAFVVERRGVTAIVTRADLQKPPVRTLLFGLISLLDMHLTYWINEIYPQDSWQNSLSEGRLNKLRELLQARRQRNEVIGEIDCLQLGDKKTIISKSARGRELLGLASRLAAESTLDEIEALRDRVAHSQGDLAGPGGWASLGHVLGDIESLLERSDAAVDNSVASSSVVTPQLPQAVSRRDQSEPRRLS